MGRILCIDYGRKRCGIAVTDTLRITATGLPTVPAAGLMSFLKDYCGREQVDEIVVGYPTQMNGEDSESMRYIRPFLARLRKEMPQVLAAGFRKKDRQRKELADEMAAVLILNGYLDSLDMRSSC